MYIHLAVWLFARFTHSLTHLAHRKGEMLCVWSGATLDPSWINWNASLKSTRARIIQPSNPIISLPPSRDPLPLAAHPRSQSNANDSVLQVLVRQLDLFGPVTIIFCLPYWEIKLYDALWGQPISIRKSKYLVRQWALCFGFGSLVIGFQKCLFCYWGCGECFENLIRILICCWYSF